MYVNLSAFRNDVGSGDDRIACLAQNTQKKVTMAELEITPLGWSTVRMVTINNSVNNTEHALHNVRKRKERVETYPDKPTVIFSDWNKL